MVNPTKLKKLKIVLEKNNTSLKAEEIEEILQHEKNEDLKNFLTGLKHISERHYTEAIKWLQLSNCKDASALIALLAFKVGDMFLYEEYANEKVEKDCIKQLNISIYLSTDTKKIPFSIENIKKLPEII
ncbi:hypothetical protein SAMN06265182_1005 [Persephonella hydrogeniphila]|uniref:Uncharacterized protein n=1 Tax=Persephonella hydrogeniphila TaxID=198703 RepID=A0A285NE90_9AQUI|nr:hypothetical protein [Persephonella hydrogeniphila]SNZ07760.1 hypothetical protein SAMN06265182_1005 [Persephonella hydrogeniphila]